MPPQPPPSAPPERRGVFELPGIVQGLIGFLGAILVLGATLFSQRLGNLSDRIHANGGEIGRLQATVERLEAEVQRHREQIVILYQRQENHETYHQQLQPAPRKEE